jgi:hypothetical protein
MPNSGLALQATLISVLLAAVKIFDFTKCPKNGIFLLGFGTHRAAMSIHAAP